LAENNMLHTDYISNIFINGNWAYAPANWIGFLGVLGFGLGEQFEGASRGNLRIGGLVSIDFQNVKGIKFPIGLAFSTKYNSFSETSEKVDNIITYGFSIGYTGHKDFDIIIESIFQSLDSPTRVEDRIDFLQSIAKISYYF
jgi:hypothetical protein